MPVKIRFTAILFTLFASSFAYSTALANSKTLSGVLTINDGASVIATFDNGSAGPLINGDVTLKYGKAGFWSEFTGSRQIEIQQDGKSAQVFLEESSFQSFANFITDVDYENGQAFQLIGRETNPQIEVSYKNASTSCSVAGACEMCEFKTFKGIIKNVCKFGLYENCPGTQDVYGKVTRTTVTPVISIVGKSPVAELAQITGLPLTHSQFKSIRPLSDCKKDN